MMIETDRLIIRKFDIFDTEALYKILSNEMVMQYLEPVYDFEKTAAFINDYAMCEPPKVFALEYKRNNSVIGHLIYHPYDNESYEIGWIIDDKFWNKGIASEITVAVIDYARKSNISSIVIECHCNQTITRRIAEKYGFKLIEQNSLCVYKLVL